MIKVRLLDDAVIVDEVFRAGDIVELDRSEAKSLIERGKAEPAPVVVEVDSFRQDMQCNS